jgi:hypothetical protein
MKKILKSNFLKNAFVLLIQKIISRSATLKCALLARIAPPGLNVSLDANDKIGKQLDDIPSECSPSERRYLYNFFRHIWSGVGQVVEIGPFLGGSSRAIALGMIDNPRISSDSRLITFDRFGHYYGAEALKSFLQPVVKTGLVSEKQLEDMGANVNFFEIYKTIHANSPYAHILLPIDQCVPDSKEQLEKGGQFLNFSDGTTSDAVFIDGCKSWFGTKYFMRKALAISRPGTWFLFQDYGWYTCFWLSSFMYFFREYFELFSNVDFTYTFRLKSLIPASEIDRIFPDKPECVEPQTFQEIYDFHVSNALERRDYLAATAHSIHHAGALAYIGEKARAKQMLLQLQKVPWVAGYEKHIRAALISPTYSPTGEIRF